MHIKQIRIRDQKRVIIMSDIHGDLDLLEKLLSQVAYHEEDVLIINGDLCEKGPNSLGVVRRIMKLAEESRRIYVTQGNCDILIKHVLNHNDSILEYMRKRKHSILNEMLEEQGRQLDDFSTLKELSKFYHAYYANEIGWLLALPVAIETEDHIIIHAGIETIDNWKDTSLDVALSIPAFYEKGHKANKIVVVGHWPVINYTSTSISHNNPIIDRDRKIICLDGGNQVKFDGQLNAIIIVDDIYSHTYVDHQEVKREVLKSYQAPEGFLGAVTYPNYQLKKLVQEDHFTLCENVNLHIEQWVKNEYIEERQDGTYCKGDLSTTLLSVKAGDVISLLDDNCEAFVLVKKDGEVGWIPRDCI